MSNKLTSPNQSAWLTQNLSRCNAERDKLVKDNARLNSEADLLRESLRRVCDATGCVDVHHLHTIDLIMATDIAIEWVESAKRVL
jgi:hypothetical protein